MFSALQLFVLLGEKLMVMLTLISEYTHKIFQVVMCMNTNEN